MASESLNYPTFMIEKFQTTAKQPDCYRSINTMHCSANPESYEAKFKAKILPTVEKNLKTSKNQKDIKRDYQY